MGAEASEPQTPERSKARQKRRWSLTIGASTPIRDYDDASSWG